MSEGSIYGSCGQFLPEVLRVTKERIERLGSNGEGKPAYEHLRSRIKTEESMRRKLLTRGLPQTPEAALTQLHDSVGIRIVCLFIDDIYAMADRIRGCKSWRVVLEKDYIRTAKSNGYRSFHMILDTQMPFADIRGNTPGHYPVEVQLRTIAMDTWAALEHELQYKKTTENTELIVSELARVASELASCDVSMQTIRNLIRELRE